MVLLFSVLSAEVPHMINHQGRLPAADVVYLIAYLFRYGTPPSPLQAGDVNCDGEVNPGDVVYLINYLFRDGPPPCEP
jgi:hypothetical protein